MQIICINNVFLNNFLFSIFGPGSFLEAFSALKHKKINKVCLYSYVFYCFMISAV